MAALSADNRAIIESWAGTVSDKDEPGFETRIGALGSAEAAALERMTRDYADMAKTPSRVGSGVRRLDHTKNLEVMAGQISDLVSYMVQNTTDVILTTAGTKLLNRAISMAADETIVVSTSAGNRRRGG